jgi:integrase/recombinase XerD
MKIDRHGQAKILTQSEIQLLFSQGLQTDRDRILLGTIRRKKKYQRDVDY